MDKIDEAKELLKMLGIPKGGYLLLCTVGNGRNKAGYPLHHFRNAALVEDNGKATNSPNYRYRLTEETLQMVRAFQTSEWQRSVSRFLKYHEKLVDIYASKKKMTMMPVRINEADFQLCL